MSNITTSANIVPVENDVGLKSTRITRRSALGALVALAAGTTAAGAAVALHEPSGRLAELLADFRWKDEEWDAAAADVDRLYRENMDLPAVQVVIRYEAIDEATGAITFGEWIAHIESDIIRRFPTGGFWTPAQNAEILRRREELLAAYRAAERRRYDAEASAGITVAQAIEDAAYKARCAAMDAIFAYRPATLEEMAAKDAYLASKLAEGYDFEDADLALIFGAGSAVSPSRAPAQRSIDARLAELPPEIAEPLRLRFLAMIDEATARFSAAHVEHGVQGSTAES